MIAKTPAKHMAAARERFLLDVPSDVMDLWL
jgi:hypothetical protein